MSLETDFKDVLAGDPTVITLVGTRIYPGTYPQGAASPAIRFTKAAGSIGIHMGGSDGLTESTMQVDLRVSVIKADTQGANAARDAAALRDAILARLHAFRGVQGATDFRLIELASDRGADFEKTDTGSYYTATLDFSVYSRAAA